MYIIIICSRCPLVMTEATPWQVLLHSHFFWLFVIFGAKSCFSLQLWYLCHLLLPVLFLHLCPCVGLLWQFLHISCSQKQNKKCIKSTFMTMINSLLLCDTMYKHGINLMCYNQVEWGECIDQSWFWNYITIDIPFNNTTF